VPEFFRKRTEVAPPGFLEGESEPTSGGIASGGEG